MTHTNRKILAVLLAAVLCLAGCNAVGKTPGTSADAPKPIDHSRDYYTDIKGSGQDSWLIMVYLNAAEAEQHGVASHAISQMLATPLADNITVVVQTYGADEWQGEFMSKLYDRIRITADGVQTAAYDGQAQAGSADMLGEFVQDTIAEHEADRKALILWGEYSLSADDMAQALEDAKLDFVAFDTQPMTAFEDIYLLRDAADYLIASAGQFAVSWDFEHLLDTLGKNTSFLTKDIARLINEGVLGDDIFSTTGTTPGLYCVDLTLMKTVYTRVHALLDEAQAGIAEGKFAGIALARAAAAVDDVRVSLSAFADALIYESSAPCQQAISEALVYTAGEVSLSMYLPISPEADPDFTDTIAAYAADGLDYTDFLPTYLTAAVCAGGVGSEEKWFVNAVGEQYLQNAADYSYPADKVALTFTGENFVLPLAVEDANKVYSLTVRTFADTGAHYLLLGEALAEAKDLSGDLIAAPGTDQWLYVNGQPVCHYRYIGADEAEHLLVPCIADDRQVTLLVSEDRVQTALLGMGVFTRTQPIVTGDVLQFSYPMYSYEGDYLGESSYGYKVAVAEALNVSYGSVDIGDMLLGCRLEDIAGRTYDSPMLNMKTAMMQ